MFFELDVRCYTTKLVGEAKKKEMDFHLFTLNVIRINIVDIIV